MINRFKLNFNNSDDDSSEWIVKYNICKKR